MFRETGMQGLGRIWAFRPAFCLPLPHLTPFSPGQLYTLTFYRSNKGHSENLSKLPKASLLTLGYLFKMHCLG